MIYYVIVKREVEENEDWYDRIEEDILSVTSDVNKALDLAKEMVLKITKEHLQREYDVEIDNIKLNDTEKLDYGVFTTNRGYIVYENGYVSVYVKIKEVEGV